MLILSLSWLVDQHKENTLGWPPCRLHFQCPIVPYRTRGTQYLVDTLPFVYCYTMAALAREAGSNTNRAIRLKVHLHSTLC